MSIETHAGPSFSKAPNITRPNTITTQQITPPPIPRQTHPPPRQPTQRGTPPTQVDPTSNDEQVDVSAYRVGLFEKAKDNVNKFLGKYCFGTKGNKIDVLPPNKTIPPTHRDESFIQGKKVTFNPMILVA